MKPWRHLKPKTGKGIPFIILISFLATFAVSRFIVNYLPDVTLKVKGTHVHHFAYGIILLVLIGYFLLTGPSSPKTRLKLTVLYGIAVGMAFDEFGMWIQLEDVYYNRATYDAIIFITAILLNIIYFEDFWKKWGNRLGNLLKRLLT
jgi:hypothetical protein